MNGTPAAPAASSVANRAAGNLSGEPKCGPPRPARRSETDSNINPIDADTGRNARTSASVNTPGFRCGNKPVSSNTARAARSRYSSVVSQPSAANSSRAAAYRNSGLSPNVNNASRQPAAAPARAIASTSSIVRNTRSP